MTAIIGSFVIVEQQFFREIEDSSSEKVAANNKQNTDTHTLMKTVLKYGVRSNLPTGDNPMERTDCVVRRSVRTRNH